MKKRTKIIILSVILGVGLYLLVWNFLINPIRQKKVQEYSSAVTDLSSEAKSDPLKFLATLSNAEIIIPSTEKLLQVKLKDNQAEFFTDNSRGNVMMSSILKTQKTVDGVDVFCDLIVDYGQLQTSHFIALFKLSDGSLAHTSSFSVGNQVKITEVIPEADNDSNYQVKGNYFDIATTSTQEFTFSVKNHKIVQ